MGGKDIVESLPSIRVNYPDLGVFLKDARTFFGAGRLLLRKGGDSLNLSEVGRCVICLPILDEPLYATIQVERRLPGALVLQVVEWDKDHQERLWQFVGIAWAFLKGFGLEAYQGRPPRGALGIHPKKFISLGGAAQPRLEQKQPVRIGPERETCASFLPTVPLLEPHVPQYVSHSAATTQPIQPPISSPSIGSGLVLMAEALPPAIQSKSVLMGQKIDWSEPAGSQPDAPDSEEGLHRTGLWGWDENSEEIAVSGEEEGGLWDWDEGPEEVKTFEDSETSSNDLWEWNEREKEGEDAVSYGLWEWDDDEAPETDIFLPPEDWSEHDASPFFIEAPELPVEAPKVTVKSPATPPILPLKKSLPAVINLKNRPLSKLLAGLMFRQSSGTLSVRCRRQTRDIVFEDGALIAIYERPFPDGGLLRTAAHGVGLEPDRLGFVRGRVLRTSDPEAKLIEAGVLKKNEGGRLLSRRVSIQLARAIEDGWGGSAVFYKREGMAGVSVRPFPAVPVSRMVWEGTRRQAHKSSSGSIEGLQRSTLSGRLRWLKDPVGAFPLHEILTEDGEKLLFAELRQHPVGTGFKLEELTSEQTITIWCLLRLGLMEILDHS